MAYRGGGLLTVGDVLFKLWVVKPTHSIYLTGLALYMLGAVCLIETYKTHNMAVATAIFVIINIVTLVLVSAFCFNEPLTTKQLAGVGLAAFAIVLLH